MNIIKQVIRQEAEFERQIQSLHALGTFPGLIQRIVKHSKEKSKTTTYSFEYLMNACIHHITFHGPGEFDVHKFLRKFQP